MLPHLHSPSRHICTPCPLVLPLPFLWDPSPPPLPAPGWVAGLFEALLPLCCNQCPGIIATCPASVWGLSRPQQQQADRGQPGLEQGQVRAVLPLTLVS